MAVYSVLSWWLWKAAIHNILLVVPIQPYLLTPRCWSGGNGTGLRVCLCCGCSCGHGSSTYGKYGQICETLFDFLVPHSAMHAIGQNSLCSLLMPTVLSCFFGVCLFCIVFECHFRVTPLLAHAGKPLVMLCQRPRTLRLVQLPLQPLKPCRHPSSQLACIQL